MARCSARTARGNRCKRSPVTGSDLCVSHLGKAGRSTVLTTQVEELIVTMLRAGNYVETAVAAAGVGRATYYEWLERGDPKGTKPADQPFRDFRERVEKAKAEGEARNVTLISKAAGRSWQAAAWMLERQHPERWARPTAAQLNGDRDPGGDGDGKEGSGDAEPAGDQAGL